MSNDNVTNLEEHRCKLLNIEVEEENAINSKPDSKLLETFENCICTEDVTSTLRVLDFLRDLGDNVTLELDKDGIYITVKQNTNDEIDAGVEFSQQVIKSTTTTQTSQVNFEYDPEYWGDFETFVYSITPSVQRCIEALMYWGDGEEKIKEEN